MIPGSAVVPTPSPAPTIVDIRDCTRVDDASLCRAVYDWSGSRVLAELVNWFVAKPLQILLIVVLAWMLRRVLHRLIRRLAARAGAGTVSSVIASRVGLGSDTMARERREQLAATMASVLRSLATGVVFGVATLMVLAEVGLDIAPLLASAGILGVALGFGAQTLVKDFLSGIFMILEDQYGVGDRVDLGQATGTVEAVGLRVTRVRDDENTIWYVRNGEVLRVGNLSQGLASSEAAASPPKDDDPLPRR